MDNRCKYYVVWLENEGRGVSWVEIASARGYRRYALLGKLKLRYLQVEEWLIAKPYS